MIWIIIIPILLVVLLGGYSLVATSTLPTLTFGWWMLLILAAASAAVSYWLRGRRRVMWSGIVVTTLCVIIFVTMTALNWNSATNRTSLTPGATPPAASTPPAAPAAAPAVTPPAAAPTPQTWGQWLQQINDLSGEGLPSTVTLVVYGLAIVTIIVGLIAVAIKGSGKWPARIGTAVLAIALIYGAGAWLFGQTRWDGAIQNTVNQIPLPGSPAAGGAGGGTPAPARTPPISVGAERVRHLWRAGEPVMVATARTFCVRIHLYQDSYAALQRRLGGTDPRTLITERSGAFFQDPRLAQEVTAHLNGFLPVEFEQVRCSG